MTPTPVSASTSASASAPTAPSETAPAAADFLALLLLTIGVGTGAPESQGDPSADGHGDDTEPTTAGPDLTTLGTTAQVALAAVMPTTPALPLDPTVAPTAAAGSPVITPPIVPSVVEATAPTATLAETATTPRASEPDARAAATSEIAKLLTPVVEHHAASNPADAATPQPTDNAAATTMVAVSTQAAAGAAIDKSPAPSAPQHEARDSERADDATAAKTLPPSAPEATPSRPAAAMTSSHPDAGEHRFAPEARPSAEPHAGADVVALHAHADVAAPIAKPETVHAAAPTAPASAAEPRTLVDQVVSAARLVVDDKRAQMHVDLQPPVLGAVRVQADVRGEVVMLTITAERPETQALLSQALPDIQQALVRRDVGPTSIAIIGSTTLPLSSDGRRAPERRPETPRERPTLHPGERRRTLRAVRSVSAVDITV